MSDVVAVVPVKRLDLAKSRLAVGAERRRDLALAFALDTVAALAAAPSVRTVVVVSADPVVAAHVDALGARVVADRCDGLPPAVRAGTRAARRSAPRSWVAVVPGDLPCLRAPHVETVLAAAAGSPSGAYVADLAGTGTTLVLHPPGRAAVSSYGPGSAARHARLGLRHLDDAPAATRHDVDTLADLHAALDRGVGPATRAAVASAGLPAPGREAPAS